MNDPAPICDNGANNYSDCNQCLNHFILDRGICIEIFPEVYLAKIDDTADMLQTEGDYVLPNDGMAYCGPVSVSNAFVYLARNGYPDLLPYEGTALETQLELSRILGLSEYMNTHASNGTEIIRIMSGMEAYVEDCGYSVYYIKYQGIHQNEVDDYGSQVFYPEQE